MLPIDTHKFIQTLDSSFLSLIELAELFIPGIQEAFLALKIFHFFQCKDLLLHRSKRLKSHLKPNLEVPLFNRSASFFES